MSVMLIFSVHAVCQVLPEEAQRYWEEQYNLSANTCSHAYWYTH